MTGARWAGGGGGQQFGTVGASLVASDGEAWAHEGHRRFRAASVIKIPLMITV